MENFLILASGSPRRKEILEQLGVKFEIAVADIDETANINETVDDLVSRLSLEKALAVKPSFENRCILASDTLVVNSEDEVFGKPVNRDDALRMLMSLSGTQHRVISGIAMSSPDKNEIALSNTYVTMRAFSEEEATKYWLTGEPVGKAGGYAIQGFGAALIEKISGSYTGVVGLPVEILMPMLHRFGIGYWNKF